MVRQYDRGAAQAVNEWRSALQAARPDQLLPLLYVANEVLQTSKRNRGPRFLEAFAAVLGQSLRTSASGTGASWRKSAGPRRYGATGRYTPQGSSASSWRG